VDFCCWPIFERVPFFFASEFTLKFNYREATQNDRDFVTIQAGDSCSSAVGKNGGEQFLTLDNGCFTDNTIAHEFVHALGFWHEHNR